MIFLLNNERILAEVIELCVLKIAERLMVPIDSVKVGMELKEGKIKPSFSVKPEGLSSEEVNGAISSIWRQYKPELMNRMADAKKKRTATVSA